MSFASRHKLPHFSVALPRTLKFGLPLVMLGMFTSLAATSASTGETLNLTPIGPSHSNKDNPTHLDITPAEPEVTQAEQSQTAPGESSSTSSNLSVSINSTTTNGQTDTQVTVNGQPVDVPSSSQASSSVSSTSVSSSSSTGTGSSASGYTVVNGVPVYWSSP